MSTQLIKLFFWLFISIKFAESEAAIDETLIEESNEELKIVEGTSNETTLQVSWFLPYELKNKSTYEIKISPNQRHFSFPTIQTFTNKTTRGDTTFYDLTPGKVYNVTVKAQIKNDRVIINTKEFQLVPMMPSNVAINYASITAKSFELNWDEPAILSEFNGYKISLFDREKLIRSALPLKNEKSRIFDFLDPGKKYTIEITAYAKKLESLSVIKNVTTDTIASIPMEINILNETNLLISWEDGKNFNDKNFLIIQTRKDTGETVEKLTNHPSVVLDNLYPGAAYKLRIFRMNNHNEKIIGHGNAVAPPNPPINITIEDLKNKALISWNTPMDTIFDGYKIFMATEDDIVPKIIETIENNSTNQIELTNLMPGAIHNFRVASVSFGIKSLNLNDFVNYTVRPAPPSNVNLTAVSSNEVQAKFCKPKGKFDTYRGNFSQYNNASFPEKNFNILAGANSEDCEIWKFVDLNPDQTYKFSIWTVSHDILSEVKNFAIITPVLFCSYPQDVLTEPPLRTNIETQSVISKEIFDRIMQ